MPEYYFSDPKDIARINKAVKSSDSPPHTPNRSRGIILPAPTYWKRAEVLTAIEYGKTGTAKIHVITCDMSSGDPPYSWTSTAADPERIITCICTALPYGTHQDVGAMIWVIWCANGLYDAVGGDCPTASVMSYMMLNGESNFIPDYWQLTPTPTKRS